MGILINTNNVWFDEMAQDHPLPMNLQGNLTEEASSASLREIALCNWEEFGKQPAEARPVTIIESRFWQNTALFDALAGMSQSEVLQRNRRLTKALRDLQPVLIYLAFENVETEMDRTVKERDEAWRHMVFGSLEQQKWATDRNLKGSEAWTAFFKEWNGLAEQLYKQCSFSKIRIAEPGRDWGRAHEQIRQHLDLSRNLPYIIRRSTFGVALKAWRKLKALKARSGESMRNDH